MKTIGIKLADGTFYPILEEGTPKKRMLDLTTAKDNQSKVQIDLYRSESGTMDDAEYVDTLEVTNLNPHPNGEPELHLSMGIDENGELTAEVVDPETGKKSETQVNLVTRTKAEREAPNNFEISNDDITLPENAETVSNDEIPDFENLQNEPPAEETPAAGIVAEDVPAAEDFSLDDIADADFAAEQDNADEQPVEDVSDAVTADDDLSFSDMFDTPLQSQDATESEDNTEELPDVPQSELENAPFSFDNAETFTTDEIETEESPAAEESVETIAEPENATVEDNALDSLDLPDFDAPEETSSEPAESIAADNAAEDLTEPSEAAAVASAAAIADDLDIASLDFDNLDEESKPAETPLEEAPAEDFSVASFDTLDSPAAVDSVKTEEFDLPDFDSLDEKTASSDGDTLSESSLDTPNFSTADIAEIPDFAANDNFADLPKEESLDLPDFDNLDKSSNSGSSDFDLPNFDETETSADKTSDFSVDSLDLPDFDSLDNKNDESGSTSFDIPDFDDTSANAAVASSTFDSSDFELPDFDDKNSEKEDLSDILDDTSSSSNTSDTTNFAAASPMDFSDLYDKETLYGEHSTPYDEDEQKKKTRVPVVICIICAIICIIATLLILFIIPSKYNLRKSRNTKKNSPTAIEKSITKLEKEKPAKTESKKETKTENKKEETKDTKKDVISVLPSENKAAEASKTPATEPKIVAQTEKKPDPVKAPEAQEDKVIISPTPDVVPVPKPEPIVKADDVKYKIKWGDTLWDISDTFYRNPWKYPRIANYNHIKNPDLILSGTEILIPAE